MILSNGQPVPLQIDTIADSTPIFADASYYANRALPLLNTWAAYGALYKHQVWINTIVRKLAFATARLPFETMQKTSTGADPATGPLTDLLAAPNPRLHQFMLWLWTSSTYDVYGEAYWLKLRDQKGRVRELHPMHPTNVIVRRLDTGGVEYIYSAGVRNVSMLPPIPEADVVPFLNYNPDNLARGLSNLEPLRQTLLNEDASRRATESWWNRGARPSLVLTAPGTLSEGAIKRLKETIDRTHSGADQMGGTIVLEEDTKPQVVQLSAEEMQYIESRKLNREEVCAAYDIPPPVVHILDNATFSNITEQMRSMYRDTMAPRFSLFESVINHHLVPDFDKSGDIFCRFDMDDVMRGDFETRATAVMQLIANGVMKPAEARPMFGLDDAGEIANKLYANAALQELGRPAERVTITAAAPASPGEAAAAEQTASDAAASDADLHPPIPAGGTRTLVDYSKPVRRGGRPPKKED